MVRRGRVRRALRRGAKRLRPAQRIIPEINVKDLALDGVFLSGARAIPNYIPRSLGRYQMSADLILASLAKKTLLNRGGSAMFKTGISIGLSNIIEDAMRGRLPIISGLFAPSNGATPQAVSAINRDALM